MQVEPVYITAYRLDDQHAVLFTNSFLASMQSYHPKLTRFVNSMFGTMDFQKRFLSLLSKAYKHISVDIHMRFTLWAAIWKYLHIFFYRDGPRVVERLYPRVGGYRCSD